MKKVQCNCHCHASGARVIHIVACCNNGFIEIASEPNEWILKHLPYNYPPEAREKIVRIIEAWEKYRKENNL